MIEGLMTGVFMFVLALFAGFEVITKVPPTLHTPLMSGANAISGITLIGALLASGPQEWNSAVGLGAIAAVMATVNVVGGFLLTDRSLNPGFAGVENELFYQDKTLMLFGNARDVLTRLVAEVKPLE